MNSRHITHCRSDNVPGVHNTAILYPKYFYVLLQRSGYLSVFLYYISLSLTLLHHPPCISRASGKPRGRVPLPQIKSGEKWLDKKKDSGERAACEYPPEVFTLSFPSHRESFITFLSVHNMHSPRVSCSNVYPAVPAVPVLPAD